MLRMRAQPTAQQNNASTTRPVSAADAQGCTAPNASGAASSKPTRQTRAAENQRNRQSSRPRSTTWETARTAEDADGVINAANFMAPEGPPPRPGGETLSPARTLR